MQKFRLTQPNVLDLVSVNEAKAFLQVEFDTEDDYIEKCIKNAHKYIEQETHLWLGEQTWNLFFDAFSDPRRTNRDRGIIELVCSPLISIVSIKYLDSENVERTLAPEKYRLLRGEIVSELVAAYGETWPDTLPVRQAVTVQVKGGFKVNADTALGETELDSDLIGAMLVLVGQFYEHRQAVYTGLQLREFPAELSVQAVCKRHGRVNQ